jgi:hypothetical protein
MQDHPSTKERRRTDKQVVNEAIGEENKGKKRKNAWK